MKQLQNGIYTFNIGEKCWGEEANKNFMTLDELVTEVSENKNNHLTLTNNVNENAANIQQTKTDLEDNISVTKKALQDQIDILINQIINLQYQVNNICSVEEAQHAILADTATLAVTAATARKVEHSLTIGDIVFNGQEDKSIGIDEEPTENSLNLINSNAAYEALELKQDKATTLSGYNITDAYTKSEVDVNLDGKSNINHTHDDSSTASSSTSTDSLKEIEINISQRYQKILLNTSETQLRFSEISSGNSNSVLKLDLFIEQGTGTNTVTWPNNIKWENGLKPVLAQEQGNTDYISLISLDSGLTFFGYSKAVWIK